MSDCDTPTRATSSQGAVKVNNTLVAYEALHDKIVAAAPAGTYDVVLGDCIWPAEFGSKGIQHARRLSHRSSIRGYNPTGEEGEPLTPETA